MLSDFQDDNVENEWKAGTLRTPKNIVILSGRSKRSGDLAKNLHASMPDSICT
jgi:hypothetical protein